MTRIAFFDLDCTLSVPRYLVDGEIRIGLPMDGWTAYCEANGKETYRDCFPVPAAERYARKLKDAGARLYVLTTSHSEAEDEAKRVFVERQYPGLFLEVLTVSRDEDKISVIEQIADRAGIPKGDCELVEDSFRTQLLANSRGIRPTHLVHLIAGEN